MSRKIMFHGQECPHCKAMMPLIERLEKETGVAVERLEVWHSEANADAMRGFKPVIAPKCGGQLKVPTFLDPEKGEVICGEVAYEVLREWALK